MTAISKARCRSAFRASSPASTRRSTRSARTLLSLFGSKVLLPSTGPLMSNGVMWLDPRPGRPSSVAAGKRPLSNMCPVAARTGGAGLALGASGGRRILPAILQRMSFLVDNGMGLEMAFRQPRVGASGTGSVTVDLPLPGSVRAVLAEQLETMEARTAVYPLDFVCTSAVMRHAERGVSSGVAEPSQPWAGAQAER